MPDQVVDEDSVAADAEGFLDEAGQPGGLKVVDKEAAANQIEAVIAKWNCERIGDQSAMARLQMRRETVKVGDLQSDALGGQLRTCGAWDLAKSGSDLEQGKMFLTRGGGNVGNETARGRDPAEPAVDAGEIAQRFLRLGGRTGRRVQNFFCVYALHGGSIQE